MVNKTADRILNVRKKILALSQDEFREKIADTMNKSLDTPQYKCPKRDTIRKWESGESSPDLKQLQAIAEMTGGEYDVGYLLGLYDEKNYSMGEIKRITGLSSAAIDSIMEISQYPTDMAILNSILSNELFHDMVISVYVALANHHPMAEYAFRPKSKILLPFLNEANEKLNKEYFSNLAEIINLYSSAFAVIPREDSCLIYKQEAIDLFTRIVEEIVSNDPSEDMMHLLEYCSEETMKRYRHRVTEMECEENGEHKEDNE